MTFRFITLLPRAAAAWLYASAATIYYFYLPADGRRLFLRHCYDAAESLRAPPFASRTGASHREYYKSKANASRSLRH